MTLGQDLDVRKGLLGKGAFLATTAKPERTSPVTRGKWIMGNVLGMSPPNPPPDVPPLPPRPADPNAKEPTMRKKMEDHRVRSDCTQCHRLMDPIGFALENFDGIGLWRSHDEGQPVDPKATVYDNTPVTGPTSLREWLVKNYSHQFVEVTAEKLLVYGLGRGLEHQDMPLVRAIARDAAAKRRPLLRARAGRGEEPSVPDEHQDRAAARVEHRVVDAGQPGQGSELTMFITKRHIPRRTFLQGAGVTLALPLLEAMVPASTALAQTAAAPKPRFVGMFFPHGMAPGYWEPKVEGALPEKLPYILESLEKVKDQTVVMSGLWSQSAEPPEGTTGSDHWVAAAYLTAIKPRKTAGSDATVGSATIDQMIAAKIGQDTLLPSLQLAVEDPNSSSSNCGEGYSCSYTNSISWVELPTPEGETVPRTSPLPMELNPQVVFERLFGSGATPELRAQRMKQSQSILDALTKELGSLRGQLGAADVRTVNQFTEEIREIERRIQLAAKVSNDVPTLDLPPGIPEQFDEHIRLHTKLLALAFKADITRVATLLGRARPHQPRLPVPEVAALPRGWHQRELPRRLAPPGRPGAGAALRAAQSLPRLDAGLPGRGAEVDPRRRRQPARPLPDHVRQQHGQLEPAPALRRGAPAGGRRQRAAQGQPPSRLRAQERAHGQPAAQRARHVRHQQGQAGRQHRTTAKAAVAAGRETRLQTALVGAGLQTCPSHLQETA